MKKLNKKTLVLILVVAFALSPVFAIKTQAQWVVWDPGNFVPNTISATNAVIGTGKEFVADSIAWTIVNIIIQKIAAATVNWINSGFEGSPAYVTDPEGYFADIGDKIAGQYIFSNPNLNFLCGPISVKVRLALAKNYMQDRNRWQCTLTDVGRNIDDFMGDFENGGWDSFFELTQRPQNNPIGAYLQAENEMNIEIASRQGARRAELDWGSGFMSWRKCVKKDANGVCIQQSSELSTPGSVIQNQLNKQLGMGQDKLAVADELNEIVSALLNQLINRVIGGIGSGLRSLSSPDASTGGTKFTDDLSNGTQSSTIVDYFGDPINSTPPDVPGYYPTCLDDEVNPSSPYYDTDPSVCKYPWG